MAAMVDLGRLSRFETPETLAQIGAWAAVRHPRMLLDDAFKRVHCTGVLPLLCVVDVMLKFSQASAKEIENSVPRWLAEAARVMSMEKASDALILACKKADALVLAWTAHGLVPAASASAFAVMLEDGDGGGGGGGGRRHACRVCQRRFGSAEDCMHHLALHKEAEAHAHTSVQHQTGTSLGLFLGFDEKRKTAAALKMEAPSRACSPVSIRATDARTCPRCGDSFLKTFSDVHNDFMWENVARDATGALSHDGCATSFFWSVAC